MSNDLISRKYLFNALFARDGKVCPDRDIYNFPMTINVKDVKEAIRNAPTAYDVDKVVGRLKQIETDNSCKNCTYREKCDELQEFYNPSVEVDLCALVAKELSIEIVKSCGANREYGYALAKGKHILFESRQQEIGEGNDESGHEVSWE